MLCILKNKRVSLNKGEIMSTRREFLEKSMGFVGAGLVAALGSKAIFDSSKGIGIAKSDANEKENSAKAYATCGFASSCSGGGGECGFASSCGGGGGQCGFSSNCSGT